MRDDPILKQKSFFVCVRVLKSDNSTEKLHVNFKILSNPDGLNIISLGNSSLHVYILEIHIGHLWIKSSVCRIVLINCTSRK